MDTKYSYYNPFSNWKSQDEYGGYHVVKKMVGDIQCPKSIRTYNSSYTDLFKFWKPSFVFSLKNKMPGYRLLWLTSYTLHVVALKIFSIVEQDISDFMHLIGEYLVKETVYVSRSEIENLNTRKTT